MIRILHMIGSLNIGGSQAMIMNLYRNIDREKIQFDFILDHPEQLYFADEVRKLGGKIYFMPTFNGKNIFQVKRAWNSFFEEHTEYRILHSHVRSYASLYLPIAKKHGLYTIIHSHSTANGKGLSSLVKSFLQYPLRYQADYFMACSDNAGRWLFGDKVVDGENYLMLPNAIDSDAYNYSDCVRIKMRESLNIDDNFVVGHVGRFTEPKNHSFLIEAFEEVLKIIPSSKLLLVGDGELRPEIEHRIVEKNIVDKVIITGNKSNTSDYYQAMDVFVFPSLWEGLGIVAIEAQASGLHCIVSERIPKEIDLGAGLVDVLSLDLGPKAWAEKIASINCEKRRGRKDAIVAAGYDVKANAEKLTDFYVNTSAQL